MATKQYTPTNNIFALLADEHATQAQPKRQAEANAAPAKSVQEVTPAARAAAKAEEERRKKEAEKAKKQAVAAAAPEDGFSLQRNQRVKEKRLATQEPPKETATKPAFKGDKKPFKGKNTGDRDDKTFKDRPIKGPGGFSKSDKPIRDQSHRNDNALRADGNEGGGRAPRREGFDKHSQGKFPRQPHAKRQGHGKGNWGDENDVTAAALADPDSITREPTASVVTDDGWTAATTTDAETQVTSTDAGENVTDASDKGTDSNTEGSDKQTQPKELGLEDFYRIQAEKAKELEAKVGAVREKPRELTEEEKKNFQKFQKIENAKAKDATTQATKVNKESAAVARKGEKPVAVESYFKVSLPPVTGGRGEGREGSRGGRGGRGEGRGRGPRGEGRGNRAPGDKDQGNARPKGPGGRGGQKGQGQAQKIVRNDAQFPSLG